MNETSLTEVLQLALDDRLAQVNTAMPAQVVRYDAEAQTVDVQPVVRREYRDTGEIVNLPVITAVPVLFPRAGKAWISLPIAVGDYVQLVFQQRSIDLWRQKGGVTDPDDNRQFDLSDPVAIPGIYPMTEPMEEVPTDRVRIQNDLARIDLLPTGKFRFENRDGDEILSLLIELVQALKDAKVLTQLGLQPFIASTQATLDDLKSRTEELRG